jgi:hypothetical protein
MVAVEKPPLDEVPRLRTRVEVLRRRELVLQAAVETLHDPVLPR